MGAEASQLSGLEIFERPVVVTDLWALHNATAKVTARYFGLQADGDLSVFKGESVAGPLWASCTPLERCSNNLLKYRHPCIVRYMTAWLQRSTWHLATERVMPLAHVLNTQSPLQICVGLNDILRALLFLHEAGMSHNDISMAAIFVTPDGHWKLGGLQYLCTFKELTPAYLKHARLHRYDKAIDPNEDSQEVVTKVDQYAFAVLVDDVFKGKSDDDVPHFREFRIYCREKLQNRNMSQRPPLSDVLQHSFFNHQFISIYKFLYFLPLKSDQEKAEFFGVLLDELREFDEETVARQLGGLLLSRLAMLDSTARREVIPYVLMPRSERAGAEERSGLFSLQVYKEHIKPSVVQLFGVHDSQLRMLLLAHFPKYVHVFTHDELCHHILPELLLGIKDTDDVLVASTLACLAELIPILGASTVIGGKRTKIFNDGRPNQHSKPRPVPSKSLKDFPCSERVSNECSEQFDSKLVLDERPSPVGGESADEIVKNGEVNPVTESEETWSDWDASNRQTADIAHIERNFESIPIEADHPEVNFKSAPVDTAPSKLTNKERTTLLQNAAIQAKRNIMDISELDIKTQKATSIKKSNEFDFFADMTPVIEKTELTVVDSKIEVSSKLKFEPNETADEGTTGWGDDWSDS